MRDLQAGVLLSFNDISSVIKYSVCLVIILIFSNKIKKLDSISKISLLGAIILLPMSLGEVAYYSNNNVYDYDGINLMEALLEE